MAKIIYIPAINGYISLPGFILLNALKKKLALINFILVK